MCRGLRACKTPSRVREPPQRIGQERFRSRDRRAREQFSCSAPSFLVATPGLHEQGHVALVMRAYSTRVRRMSQLVHVPENLQWRSWEAVESENWRATEQGSDCRARSAFETHDLVAHSHYGRIETSSRCSERRCRPEP